MHSDSWYERGYADGLAHRAKRPDTSDWSRIEPYLEGYEDGERARSAGDVSVSVDD